MMHDPAETDEFTARLRAQPPAALPAQWRTEILAAAASRAARSDDRRSRWRRTGDMFSAWLWPHPLAYAGLAAAWVFILTMQPPAAAPRPVSSLPDSMLTAAGARMTPENHLPIFDSVRFASRKSSWDPTLEDRP